MPWKATCLVSMRAEFVELSRVAGVNMSELCKRYGISRKTGYKWRSRHSADGVSGLADRSRRPLHSPTRTEAAVEESLLQLRDEHPTWGGRKLQALLVRRETSEVPAISTITEILRRHGRLSEAEGSKHRAFTRFEHAAPNDLWQMDFKGHFALEDGGRCHPLTVLDDHSRFNIGLRACGDERGATVREELTGMFRLYGRPRRMLMDNGSPWGCDAEHRETPLTVWLLRLGVHVSHGRPYHPQTQGKDERFHRTLKLELLSRGAFRNLSACQPKFDPWRDVYNLERPHEALGMQTPASRYRPSPRAFPETLPALEYADDCRVRKVQQDGTFSWHGRGFHLGQAFRGERLGLRPTTDDGRWLVCFGELVLGDLDLRDRDDRVRRTRSDDGDDAPQTTPGPAPDRAAVGSVSARCARSDGTDGLI